MSEDVSNEVLIGFLACMIIHSNSIHMMRVPAPALAKLPCVPVLHACVANLRNAGRWRGSGECGGEGLGCGVGGVTKRVGIYLKAVAHRHALHMNVKSEHRGYYTD